MMFGSCQRPAGIENRIKTRGTDMKTHREDQRNLFSPNWIKQPRVKVTSVNLEDLKFIFNESCCSHDVMWSEVMTECVSSGPTVSYIGLVRLVLLSLALLLFITALCVTHQVTITALLIRGSAQMKHLACEYWTVCAVMSLQTTRGQKQPMELDDYKLGVHRAEEEGGQAAE